MKKLLRFSLTLIALMLIGISMGASILYIVFYIVYFIVNLMIGFPENATLLFCILLYALGNLICYIMFITQAYDLFEDSLNCLSN